MGVGFAVSRSLLELPPSLLGRPERLAGTDVSTAISLVSPDLPVGFLLFSLFAGCVDN